MTARIVREIATGGAIARTISASRPRRPVAVAARTTRWGARRLDWLPETFCNAASVSAGLPEVAAASAWKGMKRALEPALDPVIAPPKAPTSGLTAGYAAPN